MPAFSLEAWVKPVVPRVDGDALRLLCPTAFHRDRVRDRLLPQIVRCIEAEADRSYRVEVEISASAPARIDPVDAPQLAAPAPCARASREPAMRARPRPSRAPARPPRAAASAPPPAAQAALPYRFDNFVVGPCNALAREASFAVARGAHQRLNPLYLTAGPGLGKTHLARAIVEEARSQRSGRVLYASAETFTNEFMAAVRARRMEGFKRRYRASPDLFVLEDVQFLQAKQATQLELFHTLVHLIDAGAQVVLTGDRLPRKIEQMEDRLRSQLAAGLVAELEEPDATVRREILRHKAASGGVRLPMDCLELLVDSVRGSVRDLEGVLIQLVASASLLKRPIDLDLTRGALRKVAPPEPQPRRLDLGSVIDVVAAYFQVPRERLAARSRRRDVLVPRQLAMYLCRRYTNASLVAIGAALGREHPAVTNAIRVVERRILERAPLRYQVEALCERLDALALRQSDPR